MKRAGDLYQLILKKENLKAAFRKSAKGKHSQPEIILFRKNFDANINKLQKDLLKHKPVIGNYHFFRVRDPKPRDICAASFPERVLHHAVMNICEPFLESYSIFDSYACRKNKGTRKAIARAQTFARKYKWYIKLDIRKYFNSIDHKIMMNLLYRRFKDRKLLQLFDKILQTYHTEPDKGLPIGNLISQHLANFYLGLLDHRIKDDCGIKGYIRYMDDFIIFKNSKKNLKKELIEIKKYLKQNLALELKDNIQLNKSEKGIPFLGYRVYPNKILLCARSKKRFVQKFRKYEKNYETDLWTEAELVRHMEPLIDFTKAADRTAFRRNIINRFGVLS